VLPRDLFGLKLSTVEVIGGLAAYLPLWLADKFVVLLSWLAFGSMNEFGFVRPKEGPLAGKARLGKTPVIDVGAVAKVKDGHIKV
jgi:indole-3-pyruvate monooxygenase